MNRTFDKAREFMYRNARPLDLARFQYHFENGSKYNVVNVLSYYQNEDGGCGHAIEADCWNPNSTPLHTAGAGDIIREIDFTDRNHSFIQGLLLQKNHLTNEYCLCIITLASSVWRNLILAET